MTAQLEDFAFPLYDAEPAFLKACLREAHLGVSTPEIQNQLSDNGVSVEDLEELKLFLGGPRPHIRRTSLRTCHVLINACIYGTSWELQALTGFSVTEALTLNLRIAKVLYGCFDGAQF